MILLDVTFLSGSSGVGRRGVGRRALVAVGEGSGRGRGASSGTPSIITSSFSFGVL